MTPELIEALKRITKARTLVAARAAATKALAAYKAEQNDERRKEIVKLARQEHHVDGEVEVDENAALSEGDDNGTYVQAWVWVSFYDTKFDKEEPA